MNVTGGATDVTTYFHLKSTTDGTSLTGATITSMDLTYVRSGASAAAKVDATALAAANSAHGDNQAFEVDGTNMPGLYRVDWPDAAFAAAVPWVILCVKYTGAFTEHLLVNIDTPVNATKISGDSTAADNCELMFDGTGYAGGTTKLGVDIVSISSDTTAADNCELMFDGTGYAGGTTKLGVDVVSISSDTTAADNCELMFDGTGYAGGTTKLGVDIISISSDTTAADNCELFFDGTGYAGGTTKLNVNTSTITAGAITAAAIATGAVDADALAADAVTEIWAGTPTVGGVATYSTIMRDVYAYCRGKIVYASNVAAYKDDDNSTTLFTLTGTTSGRTVA